MTEARDKLQKLTECCICFQAFTDPRTLPCIHTFCLECLKQTSEASKKKPGENMQCPLCRRPFVIPAEGMNGLQKNFFMENLMDVTIMLQLSNKPIIVCDKCKALHEGDEEKPKEATMWCLDCKDNFCEMYAKIHKQCKLSKTHSIVKIGSDTEEDIRKMQPTRNCSVHNQQPLNFYCADCKKIICVSCFVENHALHKCKDVTTVEKEFRQTIEINALKISKCVEEILSKRRTVEQRKTEVLSNLAVTEGKIIQRNLELKEMIDSHTNSLLDDLSHIKQKQIKDFANELEDTDRICAILKSFETYCTELISKGSASDVCHCVDDLKTRSNELENDHEAFICRPFQMTEISFKGTEFREVLSKPSNNIVGQIECRLIRCTFSSQQQSTSSVQAPGLIGISNIQTEPTLASYMDFLRDVHSQIAEARKSHCKVMIHNEAAIKNLYDFKILQLVHDELDLNRADKKCDELQATHVKMANYLQEVTRPNSKSSSEKLERHLTELQCNIGKQWNTIEFHIHYRNSERGLIPKGFQNYGNTCYFNSVLQSLLQTVLLPFELTVNIYGLGNVLTEGRDTYCLSKAFMELASKYNEFGQKTGALNALYNKFKEATQRFNDGRQHDSHDLLIHFLDKLRVEERNAWKIPSAGPQTQKMFTAIDRIFGGQFITVYTCHSCEEPYAIREPFLDISIPFEIIAAHKSISVTHVGGSDKQTSSRTPAESRQRPLGDIGNDAESHSSNETNLSSLSLIDDRRKASSTKRAIKDMLHPIDVEASAEPQAKSLWSRMFKTPIPNVSQCLKYFTRAKLIDGEYLCRNCQIPESDELTMTSATKRTLISSPPAILVLHLERFEQTPIGFVKRDEMISYDELLDLGPFCSCSALRIDPEEENVWYSLYTVVVHRGFFLSQGHYVAYIKQRDSSALLDDQLREKFLQKSFRDREKVPNDDDLATMEKRKAIKRTEKAKHPHPISGQWFYISDETVRPCDAKEALEQKAYLLFYERIPSTNQKTIGV